MTARFNPPQSAAGLRLSEGAQRARADATQTLVRPAESLTGAQTARPEIFVPEFYEPNYAYPLVVWLVPPEEPSGSLRRLMRRLSDRNYLGLALTASAELTEAAVCEAVGSLGRRWNLHTERIYLAGQGPLATRALRLAMARPEWFQGVIALLPQFDRLPRLLDRFDAVRGRRAFLAENACDATQGTAVLPQLQRLLWSAGLSVAACRCESSEPFDSNLLRAINEWLISGIEQPEPVA
ncbi:MAG: hypothetical protein ACT4QC_10845 [Planctomycetaceae bacterium]